MTRVCLILMLMNTQQTLIPIEKSFPSLTECELAASELTDGKTVKGGICVPLSVYNCDVKEETNIWQELPSSKSNPVL